ncbi:MAG: sensor histidine kinase N-terminal domain-containing protein [Nitrosomonadales bacterium]|nr:sensor histidine kinase N-terminal domain-containing protein [Nitrosomonadales bacterium]
MKSRQPSLARQLLWQLLPLMAAIIIIGSGVVYFVARKAATVAYDRALMDVSLALASQVEVVNNNLHLQLPPIAEKVLLVDGYDKLFYEVVDPNGKKIAGNTELPRPPQPFKNGKLYYDDKHDGKTVRIAALSTEHNGLSYIVLSAETKLKRDWLAGEIVLAMLVPEGLLIIAAILMIRRSVRHALASIQPLREELVRRTHTDLSQLHLQGIPEEIYPIFAEVNELLARLANSLDANRRFIADASHQLRTPIAALQAEAEMALRSAAPLESLQKIVTGAHRISHLAHQLLTLSRLEPRHMRSATQLDLAGLTKDAAEHWMPLAMRRSIDLGFELHPAEVIGEPVWLEELFNNLVDNALRYTPAGGVVTVRCNATSDQVNWEVEDSGPGIPPEEHQRVFERFYRLDKTGVDGCGLGLAIAREIAHNHHASITIGHGALLGGALLRVTFPKQLECK